MNKVQLRDSYKHSVQSSCGPRMRKSYVFCHKKKTVFFCSALYFVCIPSTAGT